MRPRLLELTAFGPYPETVRVDFDALAAEGLFLIHGPTGAGKSSLLDGLTYALYGGVPGTRRPDRLRSDHADPRVHTAVALEFSLHGSDYRVTRVPPHERAKKSGAGMTLQKAKATLCRRDGKTWLPLADGVEDVGLQIVDLLGLNREQFQQVVVLPQGDFARALQADANERRRLLSSLFSTHRFAEYTDRLLEQARAAEDAVAESTAVLDRLRTAAAQRWNVISCDPGDPDASPPTLAAGAVAVVDQARAALHDAKTAEQAASEALAHATLEAHRLERVTAARQTLATLDANAAVVDEARQTLAAARRAAPCISVIEDADAADRELARLARRLAASAAGLRDLPEQLPADVTGAVEQAGDLLQGAAVGAVTTDLPVRLAGVRDTVRDALIRLQAACERHGQWRDAVEEAQRHQRLAAELLQQSGDAAATAAATEAQQRALGAQRDAALQSRERLTALRDELAGLEPAASALQRMPALRTDAAATEAAVRVAKLTLNAALDEQRRLLEQRITNMAGELAAQLQPGEPCDVCGSRDHPAPAPRDGVAVDADDLAGAERDVTTSRVAVDEAEVLQAAATADVAAAVGEAGVYADRPEALDTRMKEVAAALARESAAADELPDIDRRQAENDRIATTAAADASRLAAEAAAADQSAARWATAAEDLAAVLEATFATLDDPAPVIAATEHIAVILDDLWSAALELQGAQTAATAAAARRDQVLHDNGFTDADAALQAGRHATERQRLDDLVAAAERERAAAEGVLAEWARTGEGEAAPDLGADAPDLDSARAAKAAADQQLAAAQSRLAVVRQAGEDLADLADRFSSAQRDHRALAESAERLRRLADICNGPGNPQRMSLERYVLAAFLEEIAEAASLRLAAISDGRYTVRHSDERVRGGGASGLSITILDAFTGTEREAGTLSGGETFQASLCLALAVAEVVQRHAGGVHLDTLFIDEGFGALDAEALEQAMTELDALRAGGRLVGVISHVPMLRERISNAIEVRKSTSGSDVRVVLPGDLAPR